MIESKNIIIGGLVIRYFQNENTGTSSALVFLHGWGSEAKHFAKTLEHFGDFVAVDLPGFGGSQTPENAWSLDEYVDFLYEFLVKLHVERPVLIGHSFGGSIAIKYAARYGGEVKKLILIGSAGIRSKTVRKYVYHVIAKVLKFFFLLPGMRGMRDKARQNLYRAIGSEDYIQAGSLTGTYRKIVSEDLKEEMKKIIVPTVLIWGEDDRAVPLTDAHQIAELIRGAELFTIPKAGHYVFLDQEKGFNEILQKAVL